MGGSIAKPRLPQTQKCIKHRGAKFSIRRNIGANTDDGEKLYKKNAKFVFFTKTLCIISTKIIYLGLSF